MTTTATRIHANATLAQPVYSASGHTHIATPTWREQNGFDVVRLACSGKEVPAVTFSSRRDYDAATCKSCKRIAAAR